jgi:hypothetical protein
MLFTKHNVVDRGLVAGCPLCGKKVLDSISGRDTPFHFFVKNEKVSKKRKGVGNWNRTQNLPAAKRMSCH